MKQNFLIVLVVVVALGLLAVKKEKENDDEHEHDQRNHEDEHHERKLVACRSFLLFCHRWPPIESEQIDEMLAETRELSGRRYQKGPVYVECI